MTVALAGACGFRLIWIFTVFQFFHEIWVLYLAFPISWVLLSVTQFIICASEIKKFKNKCATEENLNEIPV
jgi:Na+-driven multidrug efflux pump